MGGQQQWTWKSKLPEDLLDIHSSFSVLARRWQLTYLKVQVYMSCLRFNTDLDASLPEDSINTFLKKSRLVAAKTDSVSLGMSGLEVSQVSAPLLLCSFDLFPESQGPC